MVAQQGLESFSSDDSILELSLMLSRHQFDLLEQRAHAEGQRLLLVTRVVHGGQRGASRSTGDEARTRGRRREASRGPAR